VQQSLGTRLVTYTDDLVILCRRGSVENALHHLREIMGKLKLTVNKEKTRICRVPDGLEHGEEVCGVLFGTAAEKGRR
jgi:hypothetical protein